MSASSDPAKPDFTGRTMLAVFAHPDDESVACGGTLARLADAGARVVLLCASRGERGSVSDPALVACDELASVRSRELHEAARVLGISEVLLYDHPDGDLRWAEVPQLHVEIVLAIQRYQPDGVITFGEDGLYWHLDHIGVHERTYTAVKSFGPYAPPLYYVTMPHGVMTELVQTAIANGLTLCANPFDIEPDAFGEQAKPPTLLVDVHDWVPRKLEALRCHRTQIGPDNPFRHITDEQGRQLLGIEQFRRSPLEAGWDSVIEQLGARNTR
ncbi:MAG TPA: PIG-L deacetylase family protein [Vicinamibacterales bacterium]|nr:PIG-L deacetylase family protein [Vicinamibacterales bacterium]